VSGVWLDAMLGDERLPPAFREQVAFVYEPLADALAAEAAHGVRVVGVCGPQASGKSTMTAVLARLLGERGLRAGTVALDDLYLPLADRRTLAEQVHPLLLTRGVPGTHDVELGLRLLDDLLGAATVRMPRFDKAADDRAPEDGWTVYAAPADVVLFEGWCVGARAQPESVLAEPTNALEADEDPDGRWRRWVNAQLAGPYQQLFGRLDRLVFLQPPGFETVLSWRLQQEHKLRDRLRAAGGDMRRSMTDAEVGRFVSHYERLTRWVLSEMPARADWLIRLDADRRGALTSRT
jgi:D-glycerate 3-kinase